ncbi:MAG TPA: LON peptidase substrate-binding domain-containing protein, partial [Ktedonobacteraceae bacterium]|nr:LON peptidase substrate-binding domain-containing protein [Ktedonobacteraceae bacterium]
MNDQERQETPQDANESYPLVALKNMVVFPRTRMTLSIARERSVRAIEEAMMRPDRALVTASQHNADIDDPQPRDIYPTGALVEITTMHRQHDGSLQVLLSGLRRVKIEEYLDLEPFIRVSVHAPQEPQARGSQADAVVRHATSLFERYAQLNRRFSVEDINSIVGIKTAARLSDMLAAHLVTDTQQQQDLLET